MVEFPVSPEFTDFGGVSNNTRSTWEGIQELYRNYNKYFTGDIFKKKVPIEDIPDSERPELYPVGMNLVRTLCFAQADATFGEWDEKIISFAPIQEAKTGIAEKSAAELANQILSFSQADTLLWELALSCEVYGGSVMKISPAGKPARIKWTRVPLGCFYPVWDPDDLDNLLEVYIVTELTREQARWRYGYFTDKDSVKRVERWTLSAYTNHVDGKMIAAYSGSNPWGFIPFEYFPRVRTDSWYGDALTEDLIRVQDELNMRIADLGEAVWYNTHPIRYGINLPRAFTTKNFPIGPNILWDFGKQPLNAPVPTVGVLESRTPIPQGTFDYIKFLYDWGKVSVFSPPVVLGEDAGGGQRSGITLEVRMLPLIRAVRRGRSYMSAGLTRAIRKSALILKQKSFDDISEWALNRLIEGYLLPKFAPLLPRDHAKVVDEVVKRMSTNPPSISLPTAVTKLGDRISEVDHIKEMLDDDLLYSRAGSLFKPAGIDSGVGNE